MHRPSTGSRICPGLLLAHQLNVQGVSSPHLYNNTVSRCIAVWISNVARCRNGERPGRNAKIILTFDGQTKARQAACVHVWLLVSLASRNKITGQKYKIANLSVGVGVKRW